MRKIFTLCALAIAAMSMNAGVTLMQSEKRIVTENLPVATTEEARTATPQAATGTFADGDALVTVFGSFTNYVTDKGENIANSYCKIKFLPNDSVLLQNLAQGYDLIGVLDAAKEKITINLPQIVGQFQGIDMTCYKLDSSSGQYFSSKATYVITATENGAVGEEGFGIYGAIGSLGGFALLENIEYTKANGKTNITFNTQTGAVEIENPIYAVYDKDTKALTLTSFNASFQGSYIPTVLTVGEAAKTMSIPGDVIFDRYINGQNQTQEFILCPVTASGKIDPSAANKLTYTVTENSTAITFANDSGQQFVGFTLDGTNYSGYSPYPWTITLDFSVDENPFVAVENISVDENVAAEYYNLQGMKVSADNVKAGIYIVRKGGTSTKVVVK